ncbi:MAG: GntR family transcriptional regulator [Pseudomonadales bacterium]|nr:GntR family transcriptional regulator [Pseudomonadales bacterium]
MSDQDSRTRSQSVADTLRERILAGEFAPGTRMQEIALAEELHVSRTPIREALRSLAEDGLLDYAANRGYRVREFTARDIVISFRVRAAMEGLGCRLLAEQGLSEQQLQHLDVILQRGDELLANGDYAANEYAMWRELNRSFHVALLKFADSVLLKKIARDAMTLPIVNHGAFHWYRPEDFRRSHEQHHMIVKSIREHDGERAEWWMREHIRAAGEIVAKHL